MRKRALSEVFGAALVLTLTLSAMGLVLPLAGEKLRSLRSNAYGEMAEQEEGEGPLLSLIYVNCSSAGMILFVYNSGYYPFKARSALVDGFSAKANGTVMPGKLSEITVARCGNNVTVIGNDGACFSWEV